MRFLFAIAFLFSVIAFLLIFKVNPQLISETIQSIQDKKPTLKKEASKKKSSKIVTAFSNIVMALQTMGQMGNLYYIILMSFLLIVLGAFAGITFGNVYIAIALAIMLALVPFIYVRTQYIEYKGIIMDELEVSLSVITSSIERTENIVMAFKENIDTIGHPLNSIFNRFIYSIEHNIPLDKAIDDMKKRINNNIFLEWCDNLKRVDKDRMLKTTLRPIVARITDIKVASTEAINILSEANGEFKMVTILSTLFMVISYVVFPFLFSKADLGIQPPEWLGALFAVDVLILFIFSIRVFLLTKDVNFDSV